MKTVYTLLLASAGFASPAWAYGNRTGFNFGTTLRLIDNDDRTVGGDDANKEVHTKTSGQTVSPYVGYSTGLFNIGLSMTAESKTTNQIENDTQTNNEAVHMTMENTRGGCVFARLNFGEVMFLEAGAGLFSKTTTRDSEIKTNANGDTFSGRKESYKVNGTGPGYHLGGGLEIPMGGDFYFTSAYTVRIFQLRDTSDGNIGKRSAYEQKRELMFGVAHYIY